MRHHQPRPHPHPWPAQILTAKVDKLEALVRLKDSKIQTLTSKLTAAGLAG